MTIAWTEDNFLERMTHRARRAADACPDAQTMDAYVQGAAGGFVGGAVKKHIEECSDCAELRDRLVKFGVVGTGAADAVVEGEWVNAEKRLQIQSDAFLRRAEKTGARGLRPEYAGAAVERGFRFAFWRTQWAAAAVVVLLISAGIFVARRGAVSAPETTSVAQNAETAAPVMTAQKPPDAAVLPPIAVANNRPGSGNADTNAEPSPALASAPETAVRNSSRRNSPTPKHQAATNADVAANTGKEPTSAPAPTATQSDLAASSGGPVAAGETNKVGASNGGGAVVPSPGTASELTSVTSKSSHSTAARSANGARDAAVPAAIRLDAGTRVWIVFRSVSREADGSFTFQGSLLEPLTRAGVNVVAKDTEIDGAGKVTGGKTSLYIQGIVIDGAHYALKGASGAASAAGKSGGGVGVAFDAGQVQEMWLSGASVYERTADGVAAAPQR